MSEVLGNIGSGTPVGGVAWSGLLLAIRMLPLVACLPVAMTRALPRGGRLAILLLLVLLLTPAVAPAPILTDQSPALMLGMLGRELVLGLALACGFAMLFAGLSLVGSVVGPMTGMNWTDAADPLGNGAAGSVVERFFGLWALVLFWSTNGHRLVLGVLLDCLERVPLGASLSSGGLPDRMAEMLTHSTRMGLQIAAPLAFCLVAATMTVALLGRSLSVWGAAGLGTAVTWCVLIVATCVFLPAMTEIYEQQLQSGLDLVREGLSWKGATGDVGGE
jgi:flagellar biosynthetic protein FliR